MLFHTWPFAYFLIIVWCVFLALSRTKYWLHWLLVASYFFYGWWNPLFLFLLFYSTLLDFWVVNRMAASKRRGTWLAFSLINNLLLLGFFKYAGFVTENVNWLIGVMGVDYQLPRANILLPVGISFFTFQSMSYTIDFYLGRIERETSFVRFATFVSLFPQLVAGPIERASELLPQLKSFPKIRVEDVTSGMTLFVVGLFKKVALANYLGLYVDQMYSVPERHAAVPLMLATFAFAWQIYFDFSGYTDMARGVARMFGIRLMINFYHPYLATSLSQFWSRWHISLSSWFRDYVYIPLGGNRRGWVRTSINLALTLIISGFWHGAAWTFVVWGALHAVGILATRGLERNGVAEKIPAIVRRLSVFLFVCFAWIFFRAQSWDDAWIIVRQIFQFGWQDPQFPVLLLALVLGVWLYQFSCESRVRQFFHRTWVQVPAVIAMLLYLAIVPGEEAKPFIYFQF